MSEEFKGKLLIQGEPDESLKASPYRETSWDVQSSTIFAGTKSKYRQADWDNQDNSTSDGLSFLVVEKGWS